MMKYLSRLFTLLLCITISISYVSCGGDNDDVVINNPNNPNQDNQDEGKEDDNQNNEDDEKEDPNQGNEDDNIKEEALIFGIWKYVFNNVDDHECYTLLVLEEDGSGYIFEEDWNPYLEVIDVEHFAEKITYEYENSILTVYHPEYDFEENILVNFIDNDTIETDWDDEDITLTRQKNSYDNTSIIGYWQCDDWQYENSNDNYVNYFFGVKFNTDNTGTFYESTGEKVYKSNLTYEYDAPTLVYEFTQGEKGETIIKFITSEIFIWDEDEEDYEVFVYVKTTEPELED